jgi:hypothetical protein
LGVPYEHETHVIEPIPESPEVVWQRDLGGYLRTARRFRRQAWALPLSSERRERLLIVATAMIRLYRKRRWFP